jgi:hypothetical protein
VFEQRAVDGRNGCHLKKEESIQEDGLPGQARQ